jgi:biopolymer transport protein ExbD
MIPIERSRSARPADVGMAPLIDCVFLLLIFFLLTSAFDERRQIDLEVPDSATSDSPSESAIEIRVSAASEVTVQGEPVVLERISERLRLHAGAPASATAVLVADRRTPFETVTRVLDAARSAGLGAVSIATRRAVGSVDVAPER